MPTFDRRSFLSLGVAFAVGPGITSLLAESQRKEQDPIVADDSLSESWEASMQIQYLEMVTPNVDDVCKQLSAVHGVTFSDPDPNLGGARTAKLKGGGLLGVRGPLRDTETPVVRPYLLVEDIEAAVDQAAKAGAKVALPPMKLPGHGTCAIVIQGGIECGLWQL